MKSLAEHMSVYAAYHRDPVNRAIHFVMVPAIVWSLMVALDAVPVCVGCASYSDGATQWSFALADLNLGVLASGALLIWYLLLDFRVGLAAVALFTLLHAAAYALLHAFGTTTALTIAGGVFVASWVFQFLGHGVWEKRRPALVDNLFQVLVAPAFLVAETAFGLGLRKALRAEVRTRMQEHLPAA